MDDDGNGMYPNDLVRLVKYYGYLVKRLSQGIPPYITSFGAATTDKSDVALARNLLKYPQIWLKGDGIRDLENQLRRFFGGACVCTFYSGRVALSAILEATEIGNGDEVVLPGYTCVVVPNALKYRGIKPVFSDIELDTYGLDASQLEAKITPHTRAILLHHLYGLVCRDYERILELGERHGLLVIEDCAQSLGAKYKGKLVGTYGDVSFFSTEQSKVISTGVGGFAVTNHPDIGRRLQRIQEQLPLPLAIEVRQQLKQFVLNYWRFLPRYGVYLRPWIEWMGASTWMESTTQEEIRGLRPSGYGKRMPNALAMLGLQQLIKLEHLNAERRRQASYWTTWAQQYGYGTPVVIEDSVPVFLRYPFLVPDRMKMDRSWGTKMGIDVGVWYSDFLHPQGSWQIEPGEREELVAAKRAVEQCVNLPTLKMLRKEVLGAFQ